MSEKKPDQKISFKSIKEAITFQDNDIYKAFKRENELKLLKQDQDYNMVFRNRLEQRYNNIEQQEIDLRQYQMYILQNSINNSKDYQD